MTKEEQKKDYAMYRGAEEELLFKDGTSCLIYKDSRIRREASSLAWVKISKSSYDILVLHLLACSLMLENSFLDREQPVL